MLHRPNRKSISPYDIIRTIILWYDVLLYITPDSFYCFNFLDLTTYCLTTLWRGENTYTRLSPFKMKQKEEIKRTRQRDVYAGTMYRYTLPPLSLSLTLPLSLFLLSCIGPTCTLVLVTTDGTRGPFELTAIDGTRYYGTTENFPWLFAIHFLKGLAIIGMFKISFNRILQYYVAIAFYVHKSLMAQ